MDIGEIVAIFIIITRPFRVQDFRLDAKRVSRLIKA